MVDDVLANVLAKIQINFSLNVAKNANGYCLPHVLLQFLFMCTEWVHVSVPKTVHWLQLLGGIGLEVA